MAPVTCLETPNNPCEHRAECADDSNWNEEQTREGPRAAEEIEEYFKRDPRGGKNKRRKERAFMAFRAEEHF